jgi:hypothetical protein
MHSVSTSQPPEPGYVHQEHSWAWDTHTTVVCIKCGRIQQMHLWLLRQQALAPHTVCKAAAETVILRASPTLSLRTHNTVGTKQPQHVSRGKVSGYVTTSPSRIDPPTFYTTLAEAYGCSDCRPLPPDRTIHYSQWKYLTACSPPWCLLLCARQHPTQLSTIRSSESLRQNPNLLIYLPDYMLDMALYSDIPCHPVVSQPGENLWLTGPSARGCAVTCQRLDNNQEAVIDNVTGHITHAASALAMNAIGLACDSSACQTTCQLVLDIQLTGSQQTAILQCVCEPHGPEDN